MPTDPFTAFTEGYQKSQQMGLMKLQAIQQQKEYAQKQQMAEAEAKKAELEADNKKIDYYEKQFADPNVADTTKIEVYKVYAPLVKKSYGFDPAPIDSWDSEYTKAAKRINAIRNNPDYAPDDKLQLMYGVYSEVSQAAAEKLKPQMESAQKEAETDRFAQGMTLSRQIASTPELAQSPEIMNQVLGEKERLLAGSTAGQDVLKTEIKSTDKGPQSTDTVDQLGQAMFGKNWGELSQGEKQKVINKKFSMDAAIAGARTTATGQAKQDIPLDPGELSGLVDPETFAPMPVGTTPTQAAKMGAVKVNAQQKSDYFDLTKANQSIKELFSLADKLITADSPVSAVKQYALLTGGAYTRANPDAKVYTDARLAAMSNISRTLGEKGVLTDFDITRANNAFPNFGDTVAIKNEKRRIMTEMLTVASKAAKAKLLGVEPEPSDMKKIKDLLNSADKVGKQSGFITPKPAKSWQELKAQRGY